MSIPCTWDGDALVPRRGFQARADREFVVGMVYEIEAIEQRSAASHKQFFAAVRDAWMSLPEHLAEEFPSPEHLRKFALIKTGYHDRQSIVCGSKAEAQRIASFVKPFDQFAVVTVEAALVTVYRARSQNTRAMGKADFQASKEAVLNFLDDLLGTRRGTVAREAGRSAA